MTSTLASVKYVFLDVVGFTTNRSVEAQADIVAALNSVVRGALADIAVDSDKVILIPTGDGICIALVNVDDPYDVHVLLALRIVARVDAQSRAEESPSRKFMVRLGVNSNVDNLVTDINGKPNVAGAGVNIASRIMNLADGNQILVSSAVFEVLRYRETYEGAFRQYDATVKHGVPISVYQFVRPHDGLNLAIPGEFQVKIRVLAPLAGPLAFYFGLSHQFKDFLIQHNEQYASRAGILWLWYRAQDAYELATAKRFDQPHFKTHGHGSLTDVAQLYYYENITFNVVCDLVEYLLGSMFSGQSRFFEEGSDGTDFRFVNEQGIARLRSEAPDVCNTLGIRGAY